MPDTPILAPPPPVPDTSPDGDGDRVTDPSDNGWFTEAVPTVEPLCGDCAEARLMSGDVTRWCARHSEHHPRPHFVTHDTQASDKPAQPWGFEHE